MITIASLLDKKANSATEEYWAMLEAKCQLTEINSVPFPHFSWFTASGIAHPALPELFEDVAKDLYVFTIQTTGLGVFTGKSPVIYLPLIKTRQLIEFHEIIWKRLSEFVQDLNYHYSPDSWVPHITLAYGDVSVPRLACAVQNLANIDLSTTIEISNIALLTRIEEEAKVECVARLEHR